MKYDVFISYSYSSEDNKIVREIINNLRKNHIKVWSAEEYYVGVSKSLREHIDGALKESKYIILFITPNSLKSKWVRYEWSAALEEIWKKPNKKILPILYKINVLYYQKGKLLKRLCNRKILK